LFPYTTLFRSEHRILDARLPAQERAQTRQQLLQAEGLGEVIIGAEVQTLDAILDRIARAQNDDRLIEAAAAPLPQELQPVAVREAEIEHDGVEARLAERVACRGAGGAGVTP